jgi:hypothetical protein
VEDGKNLTVWVRRTLKYSKQMNRWGQYVQQGLGIGIIMYCKQPSLADVSVTRIHTHSAAEALPPQMSHFAVFNTALNSCTNIQPSLCICREDGSGHQTWRELRQ